MNRHLYKKRSKKTGLPPGSLVPVGNREGGATQISLIAYDEAQVEEKNLARLKDALPLRPLPTVSWINVDSVHDPRLLEEFGKAFSLPALTLEDILNTDQRPKFEELNNCLYTVLKVIHFDTAVKQLRIEQVSLVVGKNYLLSFQEEIGDECDPVRARLRTSNTRLRKLGPSYLCYALIDTIVDMYFNTLEKFGDALEDIEGRISGQTDARDELLHEIHTLRRELILFRKSVWPLRDVVNAMLRSESPFMEEGVQPYLRDVYDHIVQVMDSVDTYRDILGGLQDLYLSMLSNRMNEVMKVLAVISTLFIPVTFIAGVYGMNFEFMPELHQSWGYPAVLVLMGLIIFGELVYFKKKKWF